MIRSASRTSQTPSGDRVWSKTSDVQLGQIRAHPSGPGQVDTEGRDLADFPTQPDCMVGRFFIGGLEQRRERPSRAQECTT